MNRTFSHTSRKLIKYNPQLDGLRFCAVLFVVSYHWIPFISKLQTSFFFGGFVNFFFVLSSYLITRILFSAREKSYKNNIPRYKVIFVFLVRRTIRIFPAYYLFLVIVAFLPGIGAEIKNHAVSYYAYLSNFRMFSDHSWPPVTAHFWTLAVEEQFYLAWPLLIIFLPNRYLLRTFVLVIISSVVLKAICFSFPGGVPQDILTPFCVDAFAIGGILAYKYTRASEWECKMIDKYSSIIVYTGIPICLVIILTKSYYFSFVYNRFLFAAFSMKIIEGAIVGYRNYIGRFLQNRTVLYLGRISYGIYLYHLLIPLVFWKVHNFTYNFAFIHYPSFFITYQKGIATFENIISSPVACFIIYSTLTIGVAALSWKFLEKPINKLKLNFDFNSQKPALNTTYAARETVK
jgi:peptidoglycan/LPS O-acetylase OafA/YrhL